MMRLGLSDYICYILIVTRIWMCNYFAIREIPFGFAVFRYSVFSSIGNLKNFFTYLFILFLFFIFSKLEHESYHTEKNMEESIEQGERAHQETIPMIQNTRTFISPRRKLCRKKRIGPVREDAVLSDALSIMKTMSEKIKCVPSERDECCVYGEYIGKKLKSFDSRTRAILQNDINTLIFKADMNRPPIASQTDRNPHHFMSSFDSHYGKLDQLSLPTFLPRTDNRSQTEMSTLPIIKSSPYSSDENSCHSVDHK